MIPQQPNVIVPPTRCKPDHVMPLAAFSMHAVHLYVFSNGTHKSMQYTSCSPQLWSSRPPACGPTSPCWWETEISFCGIKSLSGGTNLHLGVFICTPTFSSYPEVFISSPLFHLSSVIFCILSGSSYCILIFPPHLIRLGDICSIRLHLCHLSSLSPLSHPSSLIFTALSSSSSTSLSL